MASKPIDPRPVALPNLSQLPDPTKDLFGGMTSPTALMSMNEKEVNDLFSVKPLTDMHIKPSAEAAKALQTAQQTQEAINRQAQQVQEALARQEREIAEQRQRSIEEQIKLTRKDAEEREKALKEKAEKQGGKLGAAPDGSFVLTADINKILGSQEWNSIVSDKQRTDQAEAYLAQYATQLKNLGATDEQIADEIENGRGIFNAHTGAYRQGMMKDKSPIRDTIVEFAGGAGSLVTMVGGGAAKLIGADTVGDYLLDRNERIQSAVKDIVSNKVKLQSANKDYESEKYRQQYNVNPEIDLFDITGSSAAVKLAYQNGTLDSLITEQFPNILTSLGIGGAGKLMAGKFASTQIASKLPTATKILTGNLKTGSRVIDKLVLPAASGSGLALGGYGTLSTVSDAGAGAWQTVRDTDFDTIKKVYGESTWAAAVREHGSEEAAREALADEAFNRAAGKVAPVAVATSFLGVEATIAGMMTRQAVKDEAKKLTAKGVLKGIGSTALSAAEEGFEEGYTQYASNVGAKPYTGIATDSGVSDAIGIGALIGGGTTAVTNALSAYATEASKLPPKDFATSFVKQGYFSDKELRQNFALHMDYLNKQYTKDNDTSVNDVQHWKQTYFNDYIDVAHTVTRTDGTEDTKSVWDLMTPEQVQSFKDYVRLNYGINTNDYARHQDTVEYDAIKNNNMEVLTRPENDDLLNVWRILNNTDTDQIPADNRDYYMALADTTIHLRPTETTHNTHEREQLFGEFQQTDLAKRGLTDEQVAGVFQFARTILGANSRRFTDEEQQAWNELQQEQSNGTNEQNQTDNSQSSGQGPIDENAEPVATQGGGTGTSQATTLRQAAEELADAFSGRPASSDPQSVGNGNSRQGADTSSQTDTPTTNGAGVAQPNAGVGQAQTTGVTVNSTATEIHSGTPTQSGNTGQTNQGGQSVGPTVAPTTQTTTGGGSVGTPPTKRNTNGGGKQTPAKRAVELGKTGVEIDLGFIVSAYENPKNKLNKKGLTGKGITALVREQVGTSNPNAYQVLQYLTKLSDSQLTNTLLNFEYEDAKGNKRKLSQSDISSARANRYNLLLAYARAELKNQPTTDTNTDNGSQDVDETNVADIADENPQVAVEQPVQTADDVETITGIGVIALDYKSDIEVEQQLSSVAEFSEKSLGDLVDAILVENDNPVPQGENEQARAERILNKTLPTIPTTGENKAVNADGTPVVVYRGANFDLSTMSYRGYMFFSDNKAVAETYVPAENGKLYAATLVLRNPAVIDVDGGNWDNLYNEKANKFGFSEITNTPDDISDDEYHAIMDSAYDTYEGAQKVRRELETRGIITGDIIRVTQGGVSEQDELNFVSTNDFAEQAMQNGYDGAIIRNVIDVNDIGSLIPSTIYIAFSTEQIIPYQEEQYNADEQNQTQNEPRESQATADTNPTQDTAGASGLSSNTQTTASQAELVKRGGRSKKKTTTQSDLIEQEQTNADKQAEGISQERRTGLSSEYRQTTERTTTPLDIGQESQAYKNELKADFLHRVQNGEILAIQRHIDEFTKQLIAKKDDDIRATNTAKKRAKDFAEVTTPVSVIDDMLETARSGGSNFNIDLNVKILDPATGDGRYLLRALVRRSSRIFMESDLVAGNILRALASLTGVELQTENAQRARNNLYSVGLEYFKLANIDPTPYINALQQITTNAIIEGDTLNPNSDMLVHTYTVIDDIGVQHYTAPYADVVQGKNNLTQQDTIIFDSITQQEQTNETQDNLGQSVQPTQERTQDENQTDIVGDDDTTNDGQGEILGQSGQPVSEQSQESGTETTQDTDQLGVDTPTYYADNLTARERKAIKEIADNDGVDIETVYQAIADGNIHFFSGRGDSQGASLVVMAKELVGQEVATNMSAAKDLINRLTTPPVSQETPQTTQKAKTGRELIQDYLNANPREHATVRSYFNEQQALAQRAVDENSDNMTNEIVSNHNLFNGSEIDFIEKMLGDRPFTGENIAQVIADTRTVYTAGITFDSLPTPVQNIIRKIWDKIKSTVAAISMALAIATGTTLTIPTEANAATPTETAVVQNIVEQNDNQGKQFIVADKQAGTLTMYTASGQQITSTPALFGKTEGDSVSSKNTPSGRFETKQANVRTEGYGGSAQVLTQNGQNLQLGGSPYAIHRVYTKYASENRQGRLDTPTATDNRISHGCINVPVDFYDTYLNSDQDTVVYVMPETDAGRTGVFDVVPTATQNTKEQVEPAYDNANAQSVEVTPEQLTNAIPHDQVKVAPKLVPTPLIVKGAEQSTQVAYTTPTVLGGANGTAPITADRIVTPKIDGKVVHTPAEQRADTSFDTEPVKDKTDDGVSLAQVAIGLAAAFAGGMYVNRRRERKKAKKLESKKRTPVADNPPPTDSEPTPDPTPNMPQDLPTTEQVQDEVDEGHNEQVNKNAANGKDIPSDIKAPPQPTATALAVNREMWLKYLVETNQLGYTGSEEMADMLLNTLRGFEYSNLSVMTDLSYQQANDGTFADHRWWGDGEVNTDRIGIYNKFINIAAGATPVFDNFMGKLGIVRGGHEADSSLASIALAQVKAKTLGANAQIYKFYVKPMEERTKLLAQELRRGDGEVELATGRVATAKHILNEAADAMWRGFEAELVHLQDSLDKVNADLAANPSNKDYPLRTMNTAKKLEDEIRQVSELYTRTRNMYEGKTAWDGETKLPGGMTKARAEQDIAEVKAEYGADYARIEENAKELTKTIRGIRQFATAAGVFTNADIEVFNELGFDEYVPLYSEERDPTDVNEEDNYTQTSTMDRLMQGIPLTQARSMGLTKDLSRYRRKGAKSPAADGFTNMKKFAMNMAGRVGQQNWVEMTQQLYEGTVGKPYSAANITDPDTLADLNASYDSGKVPGLIRVRPGMKDFLPADVKARIDKVRPIIGKGANANGDTVAFEYYWTEPAIQAEIYANTDLSDTLTADYLRSIGTATRAAARLVTVGKPVWIVYNFVRDSFERVSVMLMRPVKDQSGKLVPKWKLATEFFRVLPTIVLNSRDIYRYLVLGEVKTPLQTMLNEAVGEGSINLMTTLTEKHSIISELKKSQLEKAGKKISKWLGDTANKTGAGGARNALTKGLDFYIVAMTEVPQVATALASYMAYQNVGVNKKESANRVRDAYDPNRTNNKIIHNIGQVHPFVRSNFSGHYNLSRSLTQYWRPGEWQFTLAYTLGGTLGVISLLSMMSGMFDDDDDGRSALARLPLSTLMGGLPVPWGENGVWTLPVGFGMNKFIWGIGANFYRYINGYQGAGETAMGLAGLLVDNTSPIQATGGSSLAENPTAAAVLTATPMLLKPIVEMGFNTKAYGGGKVLNKDTPRDQLDSQQDNFNTPETYKKWAMWLNESGFGDYRPETVQHLFESYGNLAGPLSAIPQSVIADQSEKTLGNKERKGEVFGATLTALGAGMSIQPNALDVANLTYEMDARRYELHRKYGVGETHTEEIYEQYAQRGKRGGIQEDAKYVTEVRLREKGVSEEHIKYIVNGMAYQEKRQDLDKEFKDLALEYNRLVASGKEDLQLRKSVQDAWDALEKLTNDYVKENNNVFFTLR